MKVITLPTRYDGEVWEGLQKNTICDAPISGKSRKLKSIYQKGNKS